MDIFTNNRSLMYLTIYIVIYVIWFSISLVVLIKYMNLSKNSVDLNKYKYYREVPSSYGPQILGYLLTQNSNDPRYMSASILELIRKGILKVEKTEEDYKIIDMDPFDRKTVYSSEKLLKDWLIQERGDGKCFFTKDLRVFTKSDISIFNKMLSEWRKLIAYEANCLGFFKRVNKGKYLAFFMLGIILILIVSGRFCFIIPEYGLVMQIGMIILFVFSMFTFFYIDMKLIRSERGQEEYAKVMGLKRFLKSFGKFKNKQFEEVHLWEEYLVWATALGIANDVHFDLKISTIDLDSYDSKYIKVFAKSMSDNIRKTRFIRKRF